MPDTLVDFNVNDAVHVRLTAKGKSILDPQIATNGYARYSEDSEGWSRWQLWVLMDLFGEHLFNGCELPFEANIRFEQRNGQ